MTAGRSVGTGYRNFSSRLLKTLLRSPGVPAGCKPTSSGSAILELAPSIELTAGSSRLCVGHGTAERKEKYSLLAMPSFTVLVPRAPAQGCAAASRPRDPQPRKSSRRA